MTSPTPVSQGTEAGPIVRSPFMQGLALIFGVLGLGLVKVWPVAAAAAFAAGGLCLVLGRRGEGDLIDDILPPVAPRQRWEPYFLAALLGLGLLTFAWKLGSIPEGANYSEGYLAVRSTAIANAGHYVAYDEGEVPWPTLYHYEGDTAVRWFGQSARSFRLPSVAWAMIILVLVYFTLRIVFSAPTAAVGSLLWLAFHFDMHFARRYSPILMLCLPGYLCLASIVLGVRTGRWWWWLAAGFASAVALHGYLPGRVFPGVLFAFSLWLLWRPSFGVKASHLAFAWGAFFITAYPIFQFALSRPVEYNASLKLNSVINTETPFTGLKSVTPYVMAIKNGIGPYLLMYHVRGNSEYEEDDSYSRPVLDPVMGVLFALGFFFCLFRFWKGVPFYLLVLFWLGMIPGCFTKLGLAPFPRRAIVAFPAVFMMGALVLEELRLGLFKALPTRRWLTAGLLIGSVLLVRQWRHYWDYTHTPGFRRFTNTTCYFAGNELREHRGKARAVVSQSILQSSPSRNILMPPDVPVQEVTRAENYIFLDPGQDVLMLLAPHLETLLPTLKEVYPHADIKLYRQPEYDDQAYLLQQMRDTIFNAFCPDLTNPSLLLARVLIPASDLEARAGWLDLDSPGMVLKASDPVGAQAHAGASLHLGATVNVDTVGNTLLVSAPWPGWHLKVDGKSLPLNKPFFARGNTRFIELQGTVPKTAQGPLPLAVLAGPAHGRINLLAWRFNQGLTVSFLRGMKPDLDRKAEYSCDLLVPVLRWAEDYRLVDYPAQIRVTGSFIPPTSGEWHLRLRWPGTDAGIVHLQGAVPVPDAIGGPDTEVKAVLEAGKPVALRVDYPMNLSMAAVAAFLLETKAPGDTQWHWIDAHALRPQ